MSDLRPGLDGRLQTPVVLQYLKHYPRLMLIQLPLLYLSVGVVKLRDRPRSDTLIAMHPWWLIAGGVLLVAIMVGLFRPRRPQGHDLGVISSQWIAQHRSSTHDSDR